MMRIAVLVAVVVTAGVVACDSDSAVTYDVSISFNSSYTQQDIDETDALLRAYDDGLEYVVQESFPPTGVATLETDEPDFCQTVKADLEAKTYVEAVLCEETGDEEPVGDSNEPVTNP